MIEGERVAVAGGAGARLITQLHRREAGVGAMRRRDDLIDRHRVGVVGPRLGSEVGAGEPGVGAAVPPLGMRMP